MALFLLGLTSAVSSHCFSRREAGVSQLVLGKVLQSS